MRQLVQDLSNWRMEFPRPAPMCAEVAILSFTTYIVRHSILLCCVRINENEQNALCKLQALQTH
jgi:hypothetical protein